MKQLSLVPDQEKKKPEELTLFPNKEKKEPLNRTLPKSSLEKDEVEDRYHDNRLQTV